MSYEDAISGMVSVELSKLKPMLDLIENHIKELRNEFKEQIKLEFEEKKKQEQESFNKKNRLSKWILKKLGGYELIELDFETFYKTGTKYTLYTWRSPAAEELGIESDLLSLCYKTEHSMSMINEKVKDSIFLTIEAAATFNRAAEYANRFFNSRGKEYKS